MPFSRSRSMESMTRSATSEPSRNAPDCQSIASTSVVLPWSTCATIAMLRRSSRSVVSAMAADECRSWVRLTGCDDAVAPGALAVVKGRVRALEVGLVVERLTASGGADPEGHRHVAPGIALVVDRLAEPLGERGRLFGV